MRKDKLIEGLESIADIENFASNCSWRPASLTSNGRIRSKFYLFADTVEANKDLVIERLISLA